MADQTVTASYTPRDVPVPPVSTAQLLSDLQWTSLLALADTVIPSIRAQEDARSPADKVVRSSELNQAVSTLAAGIPGPDAVQLARKYLEERPSDNPHFKEAIQRLLADFMPEEGRNGLSLIFNALK